MKKWRYWILGGTGVFLAIVIAGAGVMLETRAGLHWAVEFAQAHSGGALQIGQADGRLAGPFTLEHVRVDLSGAIIQADTVRIDWHPLALLLGKISITQLHGSGIRIQPAPATTPASTASPGLPSNIELPVSIRIGQASLRDLTWKDAKSTLHLSSLDFTLQASSRRISIGKLEARGPMADIEGSVQVHPRGSWLVNADLISRLRPSGYPEIAGRTRLRGALRGSLLLQLGLSSPFQGTLRVQASHLLGQPRFRGTLQVQKLDPNRIRNDWPKLQTAAGLAFSGSLQQFNAHGTVSLDTQPARTFSLDLNAGLHDAKLQIHHLNVALSGSPARLTLRGRLDTRAPYSAQLSLAWKSLQWPLAGDHPTVHAASGGAELDGTIADWRLSLATLLGARGVPTGRWSLSAHGNGNGATLDALAGLWLGGTIRGHGHLDFDGRQPFRVTLNARGLQPARLTSTVKGHAGFDLTASGQLTPLAAELKLSALRGRLNGQPLEGRALLAYAGTVIDLKSLDLALASNHIQAAGRWGKTLLLEWQLDAPQLGVLEPQLAGHIKGHGRISGPISAPRIAAEVQADRLQWQSLSLGQAQVRGSIDFAGKEETAFTLHMENIQKGTFNISRIDARLAGPADRQRFSLDLASNRGDLEFAGQGRLAPNGWTGQLASGKLSPLKSGPFTLDAPAALRIARNAAALERNCWHDANQAGFCTGLSFDKSNWNARVDIQSMPLAIANAYLENRVALRGTLKGTVQADRSSRGMKLLGELHVGAGSITRVVAGKPQQLEFTKAGIEARLDPLRAEARLGLVLSDGGVLDAMLDVPWREHEKPAGHLRLKASLPNLSQLGALSTAISNVGGRLDADLDVSGSLDAPRFSGRLQLSQARLDLHRYGTRIERGDLVLQGIGNGLSIRGQVHDPKKGLLTIDGTLQHRQEWRLDAHIQGEHFRAIDIPEARITVSPDLQLAVLGRTISINGSVKIPAAQIRPPHFSGAIAPTPDLVIAGENGTESPKWLINTHLLIQFGEQVHFSGYGLSGRVGGQLTLVDTPGKLTSGSGELKILDGQYQAYGQDLDIERGSLMFSGGPVNNPGLDIRAIRKIGTVTAGLQVSGTLRNPRLQVFSDPPMSQSNALAYLLFGHGMDQTSSSEQYTYNQAAAAIGLAGGTLLAKTVGKQLGVDTVTVESASAYDTSGSQTSLFLGKYLSPRLYVSYGIGLYEPINLLRIRYTLSRRWALEVESGTISGADILYTIGQ